jgi:hypothetical protein
VAAIGEVLGAVGWSDVPEVFPENRYGYVRMPEVIAK